MPFTVRRIKKFTKEIEKGNLTLYFTKRFIIDKLIEDGKILEMGIQEVWNFSELYDCSELNPEPQNVLQRIGNELKIKLARMHLDDERYNK